MPEVMRFSGCKICMYADDHYPPHFHIRGPGWDVSGLIVNNPELLIALFYVLGFFFAALCFVAWLAWFIRGGIAKGQIDALSSHLGYLGKQLEDAEKKIASAVAEQAKIQIQIKSGDPVEKLAITADSSAKGRSRGDG